MKLNINDQYGTKLITVLKLDGSKAVEGEDFLKWEGQYHKNGKWSYTEGGITIHNGIVVINRRSTHRGADMQKYAIVVKNGVRNEEYIMGRLSETPERPVKSNTSMLTDKAWDNVINSILERMDKDVRKITFEKWEEHEKFIKNFKNLPLTLLNTSIFTADGSFTLETITLEHAKSLVDSADTLDSAVGHDSTAQIMTELLGTEVPVNRQMFVQKPGQQALVFKLNGRPPEGKILTVADIEKIGYSFKLLTRYA